jgi:hypothetical protein
VKFSIYETQSGEIIKVVDCGAEDAQFQFDNTHQSVLAGDFVDGAYYIENGLPIPISPQPTPHHIFNYTTKQWDDPRTLADLKAAQWELIKQARSNAEYAGFTWDGSVFDSDAISQNRITGAVTLAQLSPGFTIDWTLADNSTRTLNQADMIATGVALGVHVQTQFAKAQGLRLQIDAASTPGQVAAVVW